MIWFFLNISFCCGNKFQYVKPGISYARGAAADKNGITAVLNLSTLLINTLYKSDKEIWLLLK